MTYKERILKLMLEHRSYEIFAKMRNDIVWEDVKEGRCTKDEGMMIVKDLNKEMDHHRRSFKELESLFDEPPNDMTREAQSIADTLLRAFGWTE